MTTNSTSSTSAKKPRRMAREPNVVAPTSDTLNEGLPSAPAASTALAAHEKPPSKASLVLEMLQQPAGATIEQMVSATGWLPHTTRAVLTGFKKKGHAVTSDKTDGVRTYRVAAAGNEPPVPAIEESSEA